MKEYPRVLSRFFVNRLILASVLALGVTFPASGAAFLKLGDIKGESQQSGHADEIDVLSWSWGLSKTVTTTSGSTRERGATQFDDLEITKVLEKSTPKLMEACVSGNFIPEATLTLERVVGGARTVYLVIKMSDVLVSSVSVSGTEGEDRPTESIALNFTKVEVTYTVLNADGSSSGNVEMSWDLSTGTP